ncbi:helix-turn-helix transcriptional regulator [Flectobacillus roseus]|uniref:Helix-turn-helix transcriptional regulator n=1 Tax=Flectobacillus roseus TaxID=502259 RepID=A0ABT6Y7W9_9BACT|nr:helix-turn-helix transcriptional regulator [Flectobacillus roseus]MDI9859655.1 helix-turn-helix transcriptional regulator [Flectobacillus roseus]
METTISQRFEALIKALKMNNNSFANSIGKSPSNIKFVVDGSSKPGFDLLEQVLKTYPNVNSDWLLRGEGEMFKQTEKVVAEPTLWQTLKENYENRIEELQYTISIQKQLLGKFKPVPRRPGAGKVIYFFPDLLEEKIMAAEA